MPSMDAADLFRTFRRALRVFQLYPEGSRVRVDAAGRMIERLQSLLAAHEAGISICFLPEGANVEGQFVELESEEDAMPLARHLFELGVRELRFLPGLSATEGGQLLDVLTRAKQGLLNPIDEDLSILLWESDFAHVSYLLYDTDPLAPDGVEDDDEEDPDAEQDEESLLCGYAIDPAQIEAAEGPVWSALTEPERLRLLSGFRQEIDEEIPYKYGRLLVEIVRTETESGEVPRLQRTLVEYLEALLASGRLSILQRLEPSLREGTTETDIAKDSLRAAGRIFEEPPLYMRAAQLGVAHAQDRRAAVALLDRMPAQLVPEVASLLLDERAEPDPEVMPRLRARIRADLEARRVCLEDSRREVRRLVLEEEGPLDETAVRRVREFLRDPDPKLRQLAARALGQVRTNEALAALSEALADPEPPIRIQATESLGVMGGPRALEVLLRIVVAHEFAQRGAEEKRAIFRAAGRLAPLEVAPVLARLAEHRRFLPSREQRERSDAALEALGSLGPDIQEILERRWKRRRPDLLRRYEASLDRTVSAVGREAA